jgi:hypothetical protein
MCKVPSSPRPVKPERTCHLSPKGESGRYILSLAQGRTVTMYWLEPLACDFGLAYRLTKWADESVTYHVNLNTHDPRHSSCERLSHLRWGHRRPCKHVAAVLALRSAGRLA